MNILPYFFNYYFIISTLILLLSIKYCPTIPNSKTFIKLNSSNHNDDQKQSQPESPIQILTNKKIINRNISLAFLKRSIKSDLRHAVNILDMIRSMGWVITENQIHLFQEILNSKAWKKSPQMKYIAHCKNLLDQWSKINDQTIARSFYHAFHLLLYPSIEQNLENILFSNNPPDSGDLASGF